MRGRWVLGSCSCGPRSVEGCWGSFSGGWRRGQVNDRQPGSVNEAKPGSVNEAERGSVNEAEQGSVDEPQADSRPGSVVVAAAAVVGAAGVPPIHNPPTG